MAEAKPGAAAHGTRLRKRAAHAGDALDGLHLGADAARGNAFGAELAQGAEPGEMLEGVMLAFTELHRG